MKILWRILNLASVPLGICTGYGIMGAESLRGANPDLAACISAFVVSSLFAFLTFLPFTFGEGVLRRPGLDRSPMTWGRDPLQALAFSTLAMLGTALGASFHISGSGAVGFWMVASLWCLFAGLLFGQIIGYACFHKRIETV